MFVALILQAILQINACHIDDAECLPGTLFDAGNELGERLAFYGEPLTAPPDGLEEKERGETEPCLVSGHAGANRG